ncbi:hypothetical protein QK292_05315 [Arthrobacter sp. AL08]|uniref:hypothetical protein n=1 Tax=Micrococcaceae TaxID=1268 RepID=UPI001CFFA253|nr:MULTISPECIES: hypothetical protein [Micrococcaceae]MCB5282010.1 hypothetical protein [Arthrobacter sp. ES1]MDI3241031.1 hypothetical protein [Arthrobacter sp. AL05]MDI3276993.1 hypothetical protein [Arthrobacter sp. AL08]MDJ0352241.1 hypothetical protein [Pseudarthrobacter sp. PH31-O2]WGZ79658.1 hypothetical protein QI450_17830 [Arthrobacter sp. EM1]
MNRSELKTVLESEGYKTNAYELEGGTPDDTYCLEDRGHEWAVYYSERGCRFEEQIFFTENDACKDFLRLMRRTPSARVRNGEELPRPPMF